MPRKREWFKVRISRMLHVIARYELQQNKPAADALRLLMRQSRIAVDEDEVQRIITKMAS